jgi:hypothetical protein
MRTLTFDQFEFNPPDSEENLHLWIAAKGDLPFPDVRSFVASAMSVEAASALRWPIPFSDSFGYGMVREYLLRFAGVAVPPACVWPTYLLLDDDQEWDGVFEADGLFIRYHWWSTA